jgi:hypothetical protein
MLNAVDTELMNMTKAVADLASEEWLLYVHGLVGCLR